MSLRWRLTAVIGGVVALTLFGASFLAYVSAERELNSQVDEFLLTRSRETERGLSTARNLTLNSDIAFGFQLGSVNALTRADASIQLLSPDESQAFLISGSRLPVDELDFDIAAAPSDGTISRATFDRVADNGEVYRVLVSTNPQGALMVGRSVSDVTQTLDGLRGWLIVISVVGSFGAALVGWLVADRVLRPVSRLAAATEQVAETRRFDADLRVESTDELGALARSFNSMLSALRASRERQERLVRDANHELRTPLTSLRTNIDLLRRRGDVLSDTQRTSIVDGMDGEVRELTDLVTELVSSATSTGSLAPSSFDEIDLVALCEAAADRTRKRTGRVITVVGDETSTVRGHQSSLERAVGNLLGNAVKFSPSDTPIDVEVRDAGVWVHDRGPGISPDDKQRIFDRFYRSDATRTMPGSGLGLAIVSDIAAAHGGSTFVEDRDGGGASVGFRIGPI